MRYRVFFVYIESADGRSMHRMQRYAFYPWANITKEFFGFVKEKTAEAKELYGENRYVIVNTNILKP